MDNKKVLQTELKLLEKLKHIIIEDKQEFVDNMIENIKKGIGEKKNE